MDTRTETSPPPPSPAVREAEAAVEQSREQLAATVRVPHDTTDVQTRADRWSAERRPALVGVAGLGVALVTVLVVVRRRR